MQLFLQRRFAAAIFYKVLDQVEIARLPGLEATRVVDNEGRIPVLVNDGIVDVVLPASCSDSLSLAYDSSLGEQLNLPIFSERIRSAAYLILAYTKYTAEQSRLPHSGLTDDANSKLAAFLFIVLALLLVIPFPIPALMRSHRRCRLHKTA